MPVSFRWAGRTRTVGEVCGPRGWCMWIVNEEGRWGERKYNKLRIFYRPSTRSLSSCQAYDFVGHLFLQPTREVSHPFLRPMAAKLRKIWLRRMTEKRGRDFVACSSIQHHIFMFLQRRDLGVGVLASSIHHWRNMKRYVHRGNLSFSHWENTARFHKD